jgi:hypothetical protein
LRSELAEVGEGIVSHKESGEAVMETASRNGTG